MIQVKIYPLPLTLFLILIWTFLILAPLNLFAADKTFTCKPVVAGSPKKDGSFYVEDIDDESTPMLDVTPISQLLVRGEDVYFKNNLSREFESLAPYEKVADIKLIREIHEGLNNWDEILLLDNFRTFYLRYFNNGTESLKRIKFDKENNKLSEFTFPHDPIPTSIYYFKRECENVNKVNQNEIDFDETWNRKAS